MTLEYFDQLLQANNGIKISDEYNVFNDYELFNFKTRESKQYKNLEELVNDNPDVKKIIEETDEFYYEYKGGRGSSSGSVKMGGGFGSANETGEAPSTKLFPAELNKNTKFNSVDAVLDRFQQKYGNANIEYAIAVDKDGFAKQHIKGGKHSVGISGDEGDTIIHNHPSGSNFSSADLLSFANSKMKGIVATSSNDTTKGTYKISKTNHFDAKGFVKALSSAKWDTNKYGYNDGADWWLKKNAKKYGYNYTSSGMKNAGKDAGW